MCRVVANIRDNAQHAAHQEFTGDHVSIKKKHTDETGSQIAEALDPKNSVPTHKQGDEKHEEKRRFRGSKWNNDAQSADGQFQHLEGTKRNLKKYEKEANNTC